MSESLFVIPLWTELVAVGIGAIQGAMFAGRFKDRRLDLLGVTLIGIVVGLGGGLIRDILLNVTPALLLSNWYLVTAVGAALLGMLLQRLFDRLNVLIVSLDALTIGLFVAIGTTKALAFGLPEIPAIFVGVGAAVGGSIIRDVMLNLPIALMHVGSLYAVAAGVGAGLLVVLTLFGLGTTIAAIISVVVTTLIRLLSMRYGWSLPEQRAIASWPRWRRT